MRIAHYEFGNIEIEHRNYTSDVIITPAKVIDGWRRKQGHRLQIDDLDAIVKAAPEMLVVGTGYFGRLQIPDNTRHYLQQQGIELHQAKTPEAVTLFNELQKEYAGIVAALHLSC